MKQIFTITEHARKRSQQRGITDDVIQFIMTNADRSVHIGDGSESLCVSHKQLDVLKSNLRSSDIIDRSKNVYLIISDEYVKTVMHDQGPSAYPYRRQYHNGHKRRRNTRCNRKAA